MVRLAGKVRIVDQNSRLARRLRAESTTALIANMRSSLVALILFGDDIDAEQLAAAMDAPRRASEADDRPGYFVDIPRFCKKRYDEK